MGDTMSDREFRAMLTWWMCSDPWVAGDKEHEVLLAFMEAESKRRGYEGWVDAYHEMPE